MMVSKFVNDFSFFIVVYISYLTQENKIIFHFLSYQMDFP